MAVKNVNVPALATRAKPEVLNALHQASDKTGVDFGYLLRNAASESSLNPGAHSATSSARGLFQFVESTWLDTVDKHGAAHGLQKAATAITRDSNGKPVVNDPELRKQILALRENPKVAALMAAEFTKDNRTTLETTLGRQVDNNELYMAHFLGANGAGKLLMEGATAPGMPAATLFPQAAKANAAIFTDGGKVLAVSEVKTRLVQHFAGALDPASVATLTRQTLMHDLSLAVGDEKSAAAVNASSVRGKPQTTQMTMALELLQSLSATPTNAAQKRHWQA